MESAAGADEKDSAVVFLLLLRANNPSFSADDDIEERRKQLRVKVDAFNRRSQVGAFRVKLLEVWFEGHWKKTLSDSLFKIQRVKHSTSLLSAILFRLFMKLHVYFHQSRVPQLTQMGRLWGFGDFIESQRDVGTTLQLVA